MGSSRVRVRGVTPFLWFDDQAEAAARFYTGLFAGSRVTAVARAPGSGPRDPPLTVAFELAGRPFLALNGGPHFRFSPAFSMYVACPDQRTVDTLWRALLRGGKPSQCGWLVDRFGLSWQIVPERLPELLGGSDAEGAGRAFAAMMKMVKLDLPTLEAAYRGESATKASKRSVRGRGRRGSA